MRSKRVTRAQWLQRWGCSAAAYNWWRVERRRREGSRRSSGPVVSASESRRSREIVEGARCQAGTGLSGSRVPRPGSTSAVPGGLNRWRGWTGRRPGIRRIHTTTRRRVHIDVRSSGPSPTRWLARTVAPQAPTAKRAADRVRVVHSATWYSRLAYQRPRRRKGVRVPGLRASPCVFVAPRRHRRGATDNAKAYLGPTSRRSAHRQSASTQTTNQRQGRAVHRTLLANGLRPRLRPEASAPPQWTTAPPLQPSGPQRPSAARK